MESHAYSKWGHRSFSHLYHLSYFEERKSTANSANGLSSGQGYEDALAWLGIAYEKDSKYSDAFGRL